jgi:hypothetical protein
MSLKSGVSQYHGTGDAVDAAGRLQPVHVVAVRGVSCDHVTFVVEQPEKPVGIEYGATPRQTTSATITDCETNRGMPIGQTPRSIASH